MTMRDRLQAMIESGHDSALARFTLGELCHRDGALDEAILHLAEATTQDPRYSAAWKLYGRTLLEAGRPADAKAVLVQGIEVANGNGDNQAAREMTVFARRADKSLAADH